MKGDIQYLADSILLEKLAVMEIGLSKTAGLMDELGGLGDSIKSQVSSVVGEKGIASTLEEYLAVGAITKLLGPWGYIIELAASWLGFDVGSFVSSIIDYVKNKISNGGSISLDDVNSAGKSLAESHSGSFAADDGFTTSASNDMLIFLKEAESNETLMKLAAGYLESANDNVPFFGGKGGMLGKIFGNLFSARGGKSKILMIIAGIVVWVIKSILLGAGVVGASKLISNHTNKDKPPEHTNSENNQESDPIQQAHFNIPPAIPNNFHAAGDGNQYHINDGSSMWIVPLLNKDVAKTLIWWTTSIYPELKGHESEFTNSNSFNNMVSLLTTQIDPAHPEYVKIPPGLHTRKEVIDRFAGEAKIHSTDSKDYK